MKSLLQTGSGMISTYAGQLADAHEKGSRGEDMCNQKNSIRILGVWYAFALLSGSAVAQDITAFENGYLTFTNKNPSLYYRIEFKPNLTGAAVWDGDHNGLKNIQTNASVVTLPVGMFFRVVGSTDLVGVGTAGGSDILASKTIYVNGKEVSGTMPNIGQQNITPEATAQPISAGYHNGTGAVAGDANLVAGNIKTNVIIFGVAGTLSTDAGAYPASVPKTGQTTTYYTHDDGNLQKGVAWPNPRFTDNGNGTVTDNRTGLIWLKTAGFGAGRWKEAILYCGGVNSGEQGLTDGSVEGDWRLPNRFELESLIAVESIAPVLPSGHPFTSVIAGYYWTSTTDASFTNDAWRVNIYNGIVVSGAKAYPDGLVWPVRGGN
jgi:hypothetical protein